MTTEKSKYSAYSVDQLCAMADALKEFSSGLEERLLDGSLTSSATILMYIREALECRTNNMLEEATAKLNEMAELALAESEAYRKVVSCLDRT